MIGFLLGLMVGACLGCLIFALCRISDTDLRAELERERTRLAACGTAALGYFNGCDPEYDSASLQDVLHLRTRFTNVSMSLIELQDENERLREQLV